jgi:hypothetical protein
MEVAIAAVGTQRGGVQGVGTQGVGTQLALEGVAAATLTWGSQQRGSGRGRPRCVEIAGCAGRGWW